MITQALAKTVKVPRKPRTITSPNGWEYNWLKETEPTAEDWARLQEFDAKRGKNPAIGAKVGAVAGAANPPSVEQTPLGEEAHPAARGGLRVSNFGSRTMKRDPNAAGERFKGPLGAAKAANEITAKVAKALSPLDIPGKFLPGSIERLTGGAVSPSSLLSGLATAPYQIAGDLDVALHPDSTLEEKARATANVLMNVVPIEAIAGNLVKTAGMKIAKPIIDAYRGKNAVALEKALIQAEQQGFDVRPLMKDVPGYVAPAPKQGPKLAPTPSGVATATTRVKPKAPLKALPARTTQPVPPGGFSKSPEQLMDEARKQAEAEFAPSGVSQKAKREVKPVVKPVEEAKVVPPNTPDLQKVVDSAAKQTATPPGSPIRMRVYHGSRAGAKMGELDPSKARGGGPEIFVTPNKQHAAEYGAVTEGDVSLDRPFVTDNSAFVDKERARLAAQKGFHYNQSSANAKEASRLFWEEYDGVVLVNDKTKPLTPDNIREIRVSDPKKLRTPPTPPKATPESSKGAKEPWEMTREEFKARRGTKGGDAKTIVREVSPGKWVVRAMRGSEEVGKATFTKTPRGLSLEPASMIYVEPGARRQGVGSSLYEAIESHTGESVIPSGTRTGEGNAIWDNPGRTFGHKDDVDNALYHGKPVPAEVLADYPDLAAKYGKQNAKSASSAPKPLESIGGPPREIPLSKPTGDVGKRTVEIYRQLVKEQEELLKSQRTPPSVDPIIESQKKLGLPEGRPVDPATLEKPNPKRTFVGEVPKLADVPKRMGAKPPEPPRAGPPKSDPTKIEVPHGSAAKHEVTDGERKLFGLDERDPTIPKADETTIGNAKKKYNSERAQKLAERAEKSGKPLTDEETIGLVYRKLELRQEHDALSDTLKTSSDPDVAARLDEIEKQFDQVATALDRSGTATGRSLRIRQLDIQQDMSKLGIKQRAKAAAKRELTDAEVRDYERISDEYTKTEKDIRATEREAARAKADVTLAKTAKVGDRVALEKEWSDLTKQLREITSKLSAGIDPELFKVIGKMAVNVAKRGANSIDDIVRAVKKEIPAASDDDIIDAFNQASAGAKTRKEVSAELKEAQKRLAAVKREGKYDQNLRKQITDLEDQLKTGNYRIETKAEREVSDRLLLLKSHRDRLKNEVRFRLQQQSKSKSRKFVEELSAFPKATMSTGDMSATLRQGLLLSAGNPGKALVAFARAGRAMVDPKFAARFDAHLKQGPGAAVRERAGLYLADQGVAIGKREEAFLSHIAERLWGYGALVRASERHFNTYLNSLRADAFDATYKSVGNMKPEEARALARFINVATGRGEIEGMGKAVGYLQHAFFSPRLVASRIQAPMDALGLTGRGRDILKSRGARRQVIQSWGTLLGSGMTTLALMKANGWEVNLSDPSDPDWGKAVKGNTHVDIWGGFQQPVRLFANSVKKTMNAARGDLKGQELMGQIGKDITQFLRYKASPGLNLGAELLTQKDAVGRPTTREESLIGAITPLVYQDFIESINDPQTPKERAWASLAAGFFGIGVNTYAPKK